MFLVLFSWQTLNLVDYRKDRLIFKYAKILSLKMRRSEIEEL